MNIQAYKELVVPVIERRHPDLVEPDVTYIVEDTFGGDLVVVRSKSMVEHEEIVFVYPDKRVRPFTSSEDLVEFLETQSKRSWFDKLFSKPILSGVIFLGLLLILACAGIGTYYNPTVLTILGNVVSLAAGFFFGAHKSPHT